VAAFLGAPLEIANSGNRRICIRNIILARCEILWGIAISGERRFLLLFRGTSVIQFQKELTPERQLQVERVCSQNVPET
jgi:hypothetical protein